MADPNTISSIGIESSQTTAGQNLPVDAVSNATATSSSTSVDGVVTANAKATNATGTQDSEFTAGEVATINATGTGVVTATASTNQSAGDRVDNLVFTSAAASTDLITLTNHGLQNGDAVKFGTSAATALGVVAGQIYYVTNSLTSTFGLSKTPNGGLVGLSDVVFGDPAASRTADVQDASAAAFFSGDAGAITDKLNGGVTGIADTGTITTASNLAAELKVGDAISFSDLPAPSPTVGTALVEGTTYYVSEVLSANTFKVSATQGGPSLATQTYGASTLGGIGTDITAGTSGTINAIANNTATATATNVIGEAAAQAYLHESVGLQNQGVSIGTSGIISANVDGDASASATTVGATGDDADATAAATAVKVIGIDNVGNAAGEFTIGGSATITANTGTSTDRATIAATATSSTGDADARANIGNISGISELGAGQIQIGTNATISAGAFDAVNATARTTDGLAYAKAEVTKAAGIDLGASGVLISGGSSTVAATANTISTVGATAVGDSATAVSNLADSSGLAAGTFTSGTSSAISATASTNLNATATSVAELADAIVDQNTAIAIGDAAGGGIFTIGTSAAISATSTSTGTATATTTNGGAASGATSLGSEATVDQGEVYGIDVASITAGTTASITAAASSTQTANASNVGEEDDTLESSATAIVGAGDVVAGIIDTEITVGSNSTAFNTGATFNGSATSNTTFGEALSEAGIGSGVYGISGSTTNDLIIGQDALAGLNLSAATNISALANSTWETAEATVGNSTTYSYGNESTEINVGRDAGTIYSSSTNVLTATAATTGSNDTPPNAATAYINQQAAGTYDSVITIGNDGNLTNVATSTGNARATNIGDVKTAETDTSSASLILDVQGLNQNTSDVVIGADGTVASQAQASGSAFAQNVNGDDAGTTTSPSASAGAYAIGDINVYGTNLQTDSTDITIGQTGSITGLAIAGTLTSTGTLKDQILVTGTTTDGTANAVGTVDTAGIIGAGTNATTTPGNGQSLLTAGPAGGNVIGQSITGMAVLANTIGDEAGIDDASSSMIATIGGLQNVDILGGQTGVNLIKGTSTGDYDSTAISIKGDALAVGDVTGYGIYDTNGTGNITTAGSIQAISNLLNTVVASSVAGSATATATTTAVGLGNYNVTILGSGTLTANATGLAESTSSSVAGRASS